MIPTPFDYESPATLDEAVQLLAQHVDDAKILAGGHSLIPAMKLRLAQPQLLIDLSRIKDLSYIKEEGDQIRIGAMTTHYQLESSDSLKQSCPLLPECAGQIGDVQVRNKGTIGGSLAHADPAGDWPAAAIALNAELVVTGPAGDKTIRADEFFVDLLTTAMLPGEILREIRIQKPSGRFGHSYQKVPHPASGFAVVGVAVALTVGANGQCESASVGITGVGSKAYRAGGVEGALTGKALDDAAIAAAAAKVCDGIDANSDLYASDEYRKHLAKVHTQRAIRGALIQAQL
jgi:aerobic carbon-monoxide dehydrogenase medium subunit